MARRGPLEPQMEVRSLPPELDREPAVARGARRRYKGAATDPGTRPVPKKASPSLAVVVLAAGKGKRLKSRTPKVLHPVCGRPILWHVLRAAQQLKPKTIAVVVADGSDVEEAVRSWGIEPAPVFVDQGTPLGTGHAVLVAEDAVRRADE